MSQSEGKLLVTIEGLQYDLFQWKDNHPGGKAILEQYHEKDATEIFHAMHSADTHKKLTYLKSTPAQTIPEEPEIIAFRTLRKKLIDEGYFESDLLWYIYKFSTTLALVLGGIFAVYLGYPLLGAILVGIGYQQAGWVGHDVCHHNFLKNRKINNFFAYFWGNVVSGFSANWWKDRHNTHHAITNVLDADPDVDNLPLFVWSVNDIHRISTTGSSLAEAIIPYQHYYFIPFTLLLKLIWCLQSLVFIKSPETQNKSYLKSLNAEKATILFHWSWVAVVCWMTGSWSDAFMFFFVSEFIGGSGIALIVFMNHYACEQLKFEEGKQANFLTLQFATTKNISPGLFMDWLAGGLNYQIEHHLFPTLPRHNLSKVKPIIEEFCREHKLPYQTESFWECLMAVETKLADVADVYTKIAAKQ